MSDLQHTYPNFDAVDPRDPERAIRDLLELLRELQKQVVEAVNSKQDEDAELNIKYYNQNDEPTLAANENAAFWEDADGGPAYYLLLKESGGTQKKVALT
jgi:hypothetical protein